MRPLLPPSLRCFAPAGAVPLSRHSCAAVSSYQTNLIYRRVIRSIGGGTERRVRSRKGQHTKAAAACSSGEFCRRDGENSASCRSKCQWERCGGEEGWPAGWEFPAGRGRWMARQQRQGTGRVPKGATGRKNGCHRQPQPGRDAQPRALPLPPRRPQSSSLWAAPALDMGALRHSRLRHLILATARGSRLCHLGAHAAAGMGGRVEAGW